MSGNAGVSIAEQLQSREEYDYTKCSQTVRQIWLRRNKGRTRGMD